MTRLAVTIVISCSSISGEYSLRIWRWLAARDAPGGERPAALARVLAILLDVGEVVEEVAGAGDRAEDREGEAGLRDRARVGELERSDERDEQKDVLGPLLRPRR